MPYQIPSKKAQALVNPFKKLLLLANFMNLSQAMHIVSIVIDLKVASASDYCGTCDHQVVAQAN